MAKKKNKVQKNQNNTNQMNQRNSNYGNSNRDRSNMLFTNAKPNISLSELEKMNVKQKKNDNKKQNQRVPAKFIPESPFKSEAKKGRKILIIVDMQNDFINGVLSNSKTRDVESKVVDKLTNHFNEYDAFYFTRDVHYENYLNTLEGKKLPVEHCIFGTDGIKLTDSILSAIKMLRENHKYVKIIDKHTFGSNTLTDMLSCVCGNNDEIELVGVCTDICVVSNALSLRQAMPNRVIKVDSNCCAGTSVEAHNSAMIVMKNCQIDIIE